MTSSSASSTALAAGIVLDNRYRLEQPIGDGGMGRVWAAEHVSLGNTVAIKVLHGNVMHDEEPRARFAREARVMAQLGDMSRHITRVIEHGVLDDGVPYLVMERLRGEGLDACLKRERVLPLARVADIVGQLCKALAVAHAEGIVHRDLKPANIFLCADEDGGLWVKLLDFGVAKALAEAGEQTGKGQVIGTPNYMSPEQLQTDAQIDHRADLFAVGTIAYRCAAGRVAFGKGTIQEMATRILTSTPAAPSTLNPALPVAFDEFVAKCMAKAPGDRYQTARELSEALNSISEEATESAKRLALDDPAERASLTPSSARRAAPRRRVALGVGVLVAAAVAASGLVMLRSRGSSAEVAGAGRNGPTDQGDRSPARPTPSASVSVTSPADPVPGGPQAAGSTGAVSSSAPVDSAPEPDSAAPSAPSSQPSAPPAATPPRGQSGRHAPRPEPTVDRPPVDTWHKKDEM
jgi:serine/threonine protein kinase